MSIKPKWLLLSKDDKYRSFKNKLSVYILILSLVLPIAILVDAIQNKLWRQILEFLGVYFVTFSLVVLLSENGAVSTIIMWIGILGYWIYYNSIRIDKCLFSLEKKGWKIVSSSDASSLKQAKSEWENSENIN